MSNDPETFKGLSYDQGMELALHVIDTMSLEELDRIFDCRWHINFCLEVLEYPMEHLRDNNKLLKYIDELTKNKSP